MPKKAAPRSETGATAPEVNERKAIDRIDALLGQAPTLKLGGGAVTLNPVTGTSAGGNVTVTANANGGNGTNSATGGNGASVTATNAVAGVTTGTAHQRHRSPRLRPANHPPHLHVAAATSANQPPPTPSGPPSESRRPRLFHHA